MTDARIPAPPLLEGITGSREHSTDPATPRIEVPVSLTVDTMPFIDGFETGDTSRWDTTVAN